MASPRGARRRSAPSTATARVRGGGAADAARLGAAAGPAAVAAGVLGDVGGGDAVAALEARAWDVAVAAEGAGAVQPEERASTSDRIVVAVAVLDDAVVAVDAVRRVVVPAAGGERGGENRDRYEGHVA